MDYKINGFHVDILKVYSVIPWVSVNSHRAMQPSKFFFITAMQRTAYIHGLECRIEVSDATEVPVYDLGAHGSMVKRCTQFSGLCINKIMHVLRRDFKEES